MLEERPTKIEILLTSISLFTSIPANLIAIMPVIWWLLSSFRITSSFQESDLYIDLKLRFIVRDIFFVCIFYGYVGSLIIIRQFILRRFISNIIGAKLISILSIIVFGLPFVVSLILFGLLSSLDGTIIVLIEVLIGITLLSRWKYESHQTQFHDIGITYLLATPLIWMFFESDSRTSPFINMVWALSYISLGYLGMIGIAFFAENFLNRCGRNIQIKYRNITIPRLGTISVVRMLFYTIGGILGITLLLILILLLAQFFIEAIIAIVPIIIGMICLGFMLILGGIYLWAEIQKWFRQ